MPPRGARKTTAKTIREEPTELLATDVDIVVEEMDEFALSESKNIAIYGPSGVGKTVLAGGAPDATFLTTEKGLSSAQRSGSKAKVMRAYDWEHILAGLNKADETLSQDDWLVVDSGTKMQVL